jgi:ATP-binding cassette subfamily C protein LapB
MDEQTELRCLQVLKQSIQAEHTLVLVTHKLSLLSLVNRLVVISNHQVVLDGPKDQVIAQIQEIAKKEQAAAMASQGQAQQPSGGGLS